MTIVIGLLGIATLFSTPLQLQDARLASLAWRLQTANAALCPGQYVSGLTIHARSQYRDGGGLGDRVAVAAVAPGSAADRAGVEAGDVLLAVDGAATPVVARDAGYAPVGGTEAMLDKARQTLRIARKGIEKTVALSPDHGCQSWVQVVSGRKINAQADGRYVQINTATIDFIENDDELAIVAAHEMAHNILQHRAKHTPSKQAEYEADALSVSMVARAGYRIGAIMPFWTRFEKRTNAGLFADGTHPSSRNRLAALSRAIADFEASQAQKGR